MVWTFLSETGTKKMTECKEDAYEFDPMWFVYMGKEVPQGI